MNEQQKPRAEKPSFTLSPREVQLLTQRFGQTHSYQNSVVGITDERMRQLAEHFTP